MQLLRLLTKLPKLRKLSHAERTDLVAAQWALIAAQRQVRRRPMGELVQPAAREPDAPALPFDLDAAQRVAKAVVRVADLGPFHYTCLVRSVAIQSMLTRRGLDAGEIRIGVRFDTEGEFQAHAWVERGDDILGDRKAHTRHFTPVTDMRLVKF